MFYGCFYFHVKARLAVINFKCGEGHKNKYFVDLELLAVHLFTEVDFDFFVLFN